LIAEVLHTLFTRLSAEGGRPGAAFSALPLPGFAGHMVAISAAGRPSLLLCTAAGGQRPLDIRLSGLSASFDVACSIAIGDEVPEERRISVIECVADPDALPLFAETAGSFLRLLGARPTMAEAARAVARFASIFSALGRSSRQSVTGLIGELMLLLLASDTEQAISAWRITPTDSFDFVGADARVECKATSSQFRQHSFSWEQCHPPEGVALVASFRVEAAGGGTSVGNLLQRIEDRLTSAPNAAVRLRETVASTMGQSLPAALDATFDEPICRDSLQWFDLRHIPAVRGNLPAGVSGLRFTSDLSQAAAISPSLLQDTSLQGLMPL
jgi:hypothetical protein